MIRRALLLSLWTLIALPEDCLTSFIHKTSNVREINQQNRRYQVPGRLFLNDEDDVDDDLKHLDKSLDLESLEKAVKSSVASKEASDLFRSEDDDKEERHFSRDESPIHLNQKRVLRRRKGPTLSVVNPLEILRQKMIMDMARRRIQENQKQIVANADFLESLGKRSAVADDGWHKDGEHRKVDDNKVDEYAR